MIEEFPSCNPLEFDQSFLMLKADLKFCHNGIIKVRRLFSLLNFSERKRNKTRIRKILPPNYD